MDPVDAAGAAKLLGRKRAWFYANLNDLLTRGFPDKLPICGRWDPVAIGAWKARQAKIGQAVRAQVAKSAIDEAFDL